eukprot:CAMPEP_0118954074 /NCGR_PEP_ID=MMETSP1169-20130426/57662_1 /TAXON_ID=36882 /ORGANISM="Pyramimonas obovata, Strain CCMP722" /LENGTH=140 /DNA_ID=CAMNT_0006901647 /DNA_START=393 /DNA_END=812 /DNA_ORIENTATION=-
MGNCGSGLNTEAVHAAAHHTGEEVHARAKSLKETLPSDRISGPLIAASHKGGQAVLNWLHTTKNPPDKSWASPAGEVLRTRAKALTLAIDAILDPLLNAVEKAVGSKRDPDSDKEQLDWDTIRVDQLQHLMTEEGVARFT